MGVPTNFVLNLKGIVLEHKGISTPTTSATSTTTSSNGSLLCTTQWAKLRQIRRKQKQKQMRKNKRVLMKRRRSILRQRDESEIVEKKVRTLQRLIPTQNPESEGLDGLFRDTASYIISLQMRVKVMQLMVNVLETSQDYE